MDRRIISYTSWFGLVLMIILLLLIPIHRALAECYTCNINTGSVTGGCVGEVGSDEAFIEVDASGVDVDSQCMDLKTERDQRDSSIGAIGSSGEGVSSAPADAPSSGSSAPTGSSAGVTVLKNPLNNLAEGVLPAQLYGNIIRVLVGVAGILALLNIVLGGIKWMTSGGNEEKITEGRNALVWASLGLLVVLSSYIILNFVIGVFGTGLR